MKNTMEKAFEYDKWAVLGASENPDSFGYKLVRRLKYLGKEVYPINPKYEEILGCKAYPSLEEVVGKVDVVDVVVNKKIVNALLESDILSNFKVVWFQPETFDDAIIEKAEKINKNLVYDNCVLEYTDPLVPPEYKEHK